MPFRFARNRYDCAECGQGIGEKQLETVTRPRARRQEKQKLLPLYPGAKPCQRTGWCCEQAPCPFGTWDAEARRCKELVYDGDKASCRRFDEIVAMPQAHWWMAPAFGAGCCSPLNPRRQGGR